MPARTGSAYIQSLKDGREVWLDGRRIPDVTCEPSLRPVIQATAALYDLQHDPKYRDLLTVEDQDLGERIGRTYQMPRSSADLVARRQAITLWMEQSGGFLGRSPDFLNTMLAAMRAKSGFFAQQSKDRQAAVESYYAHAARTDLFLTHSLHDPQLDRSKRRSQQPDPELALHVVEETEEGLIISGGKMVATAAAYANDILLWPAVPNFGPGDEPYALACCIPVATKGVRVICRPSFAHPNAARDYPLSSHFDEMDAAVIFERALVPWDRVFLHGDNRLIVEMYPKTRIRELTAHQTNTRLLVKLEFLYAMLVRLAEAVGRQGSAMTNVMLGEAATHVEIIRSSVLASEYQAAIDPQNGVLYPDFSSLMVGRIMGPQVYPEFMQKIRRIGSSALMQVPASADDFDTDLKSDLERYYQAANLSARGRTMLLRYAWDASSTDLASRHSLYEMFYAGDPEMNLDRMHREYPHQSDLLARFDRFLRRLVEDDGDAIGGNTKKSSVNNWRSGMEEPG